MTRYVWLLFILIGGSLIWVGQNIPSNPKPQVLSSSTKRTENFSPIPQISQTPQIKEPPLVKVIKVIDGDTIIIEGGQKVRYIGINAPENTSKVECFGQESTLKNKELVENQQVRLEKDVSESDRYGRLLRFVYVGDTLVNETLVKEGFAQVSTFPPDTRFQENFRLAQIKATDQKRGLWATCPKKHKSKTKAG